MRMISIPTAARSFIALACAVTCLASTAATITITSRDAPGVGFNDPTPVAPVGGNMGTTLGQQRYNVYRHVADIWEKNLTSNVNITVSAGWKRCAAKLTRQFWAAPARGTSGPMSPTASRTPGITRRWPTSWPATI